MALDHGINTYKSDTDYISVTKGTVGIPFFIGAWPCHTAGGYTGEPQIAYSYEEAVKLGGYSSLWRSNGAPKWSLCQAMYSHFKIFANAPAVFYNVFDPATHKVAVAASAQTVTNHLVKLVRDAIIDSDLEVKNGETTLTKGTDYDAYYTENNLVIELLEGGAAYSTQSVSVAYNQVSMSAITATTISAAVEKIELCKPLFGIVPDLICAPGWSTNPSVAAIMAAKAASVNGLFKCKAVVDLDTSAAGADTYDDVKSYKEANGYNDENMIVCWPMVKIKAALYDYSVILCGLMAQIDSDNANVPYESPSNKTLPITSCENKAGEKIALNILQADAVSIEAGVVTALNYNGWRCWGNYTGTTDNDVAKKFICTNRMMDFLCNSFVDTFWGYLDNPLTRVLIDAIVNSFNSFLDGLSSDNMLYGGEIEYVEDENAEEDLLGGMFRLHTKAASPVPAQRIDMTVEYSVDILTNALIGGEE